MKDIRDRVNDAQVALESIQTPNYERKVPLQLLILCLGILEEVQKHYQTASNFDDDIVLGIAQLKAHINKHELELKARPTEPCSSYHSRWLHGNCSNCGFSKLAHARHS